MSSQLTTLVQTFDGSNYQLWSKAMKAWLQSQGLWGFVDRTVVRPVDPAAVLPLRKLPLQKLQLLLGSGVTIWPWAILSYTLTLRSKKALEILLPQRLFGTIFAIVMVLHTIPQVYKDFKEAINIRINPNAHPLCS